MRSIPGHVRIRFAADPAYGGMTVEQVQQVWAQTGRHEVGRRDGKDAAGEVTPDMAPERWAAELLQIDEAAFDQRCAQQQILRCETPDLPHPALLQVLQRRTNHGKLELRRVEHRNLGIDNAAPAAFAGQDYTDHGPLSPAVIALPEAVIESETASVPDATRPAFNTVWNAFGFDRSDSYDAQGNWIRQS